MFLISKFLIYKFDPYQRRGYQFVSRYTPTDIMDIDGEYEVDADDDLMQPELPVLTTECIARFVISG